MIAFILVGFLWSPFTYVQPKQVQRQVVVQKQAPVRQPVFYMPQQPVRFSSDSFCSGST